MAQMSRGTMTNNVSRWTKPSSIALPNPHTQRVFPAHREIASKLH